MGNPYTKDTSPLLLPSGEKHNLISKLPKSGKGESHPRHCCGEQCKTCSLTCSSRFAGSEKAVLLKVTDVCHLLGNIHPRTLARLEKRGLIRSLPLLRHKLYTREDVLALISNLKNWEAAA